MTLNALDNFANLKHSQGKYAESESFRVRALAGYKSVLGLDHADPLAPFGSQSAPSRAAADAFASVELRKSAASIQPGALHSAVQSAAVSA